jgi:hypothetical protein
VLTVRPSWNISWRPGYIVERDGVHYTLYAVGEALCCVDDKGFTSLFDAFNMVIVDCPSNKGHLLDEVRRKFNDQGAYACVELHNGRSRFVCRAGDYSFVGHSEMAALVNALTSSPRPV